MEIRIEKIGFDIGKHKNGGSKKGRKVICDLVLKHSGRKKLFVRKKKGYSIVSYI